MPEIGSRVGKDYPKKLSSEGSVNPAQREKSAKEDEQRTSLGQDVQGRPRPPPPREKPREPREKLELARSANLPLRGFINVISGGSTDGDSNRARKAWSRSESYGVGSKSKREGLVINFGPHDIEEVSTPHNDALVIRAVIANYEIARVLVDSGSSVNPFWSQGGKFLGYMVTERGIEVNPEKVRAIQEMTAPNSVRKVQRLRGRIAALSRFISRSAHRSYNFFQTLRKARKFEWNEQCDQAFKELKQHLVELSVLAKPESGERLWVYLSATEHAVSVVLVKQDGRDQKPVYYVSHALRGPEIRYIEVEKIALALVTAARRLRPYFLSHPITVLTNSSVGRIMTQPDIYGRLVKWTIELGEYDIDYQPRTAIKAQALLDFIAEMLPVGVEEPWKVYVDGAANKEGSGVGVVLIPPTGEKLKIAVKLDFRASNNEAEYEAVLVGLRAAKEAEAERIVVFSDSQLPTQQVKGSYETKNEKLMEYVKAIQEMSKHFAEWSIIQIPRSENIEADALAKMATSMADFSDREVIYQVELAPAHRVALISPEHPGWMTPLLQYLRKRKISENKIQAIQIKMRALRLS